MTGTRTAKRRTRCMARGDWGLAKSRRERPSFGRSRATPSNASAVDTGQAPLRSARPWLGLLVAGLQIERRRVDAVAEPCRPGTVVEDMSEMSTASRTVDFGALHEQAAVLFGLDAFRGDRFVEARPARTGVVLRRGVE